MFNYFHFLMVFISGFWLCKQYTHTHTRVHARANTYRNIYIEK